MPDPKQAPNATQSELKRPYEAPRLVTYGSVAKLTKSGSGPGLEGMSGKAGMN